MFKTLVKTEVIDGVDDRKVSIRYFELQTARGGKRYSAEILIDPSDRIILDADSMPTLEARANRFMPATIYSRALAGGRTAA
jgi:hypothetical protein